MAAPLKTPHNAPLRVKITQEWIDKAILYAARFARVSKHDDRVYDIAMEALIRCSQTYNEDWGDFIQNPFDSQSESIEYRQHREKEPRREQSATGVGASSSESKQSQDERGDDRL